MSFTVDAEKAFDRIEYHFMIKNTKKNRNRKKLPQYNVIELQLTSYHS